MLGGKNILLGITGGIAAYKTTFLVRLLIKAGANVKVILTESASSFVSPLTLATLSKNPVLSSFVHEDGKSVSWNNHVELGLWADLTTCFLLHIYRLNVRFYLRQQWIWTCTNTLHP